MAQIPREPAALSFIMNRYTKEQGLARQQKLDGETWGLYMGQLSEGAWALDFVMPVELVIGGSEDDDTDGDAV